MKLKWTRAPIRTEWGDMMMQANIALTKDNTLSLYCEKEMTSIVDNLVRHILNFDVKYVPIPEEEYEALLDNARWVDCLERAGVDNWDGYDIAREYYNEDE